MIPDYIKTIVEIHNMRYHLHDPVVQKYFDWWIQYLQDHEEI